MQNYQSSPVWIAIGLVIVGAVGAVGAVSWLDGYLTQRIAASKVKFESIETKECGDPRSGKVNTCECEKGYVQLGLKHQDVEDDDVNTEKIVGIICGLPSLEEGASISLDN